MAEKKKKTTKKASTTKKAPVKAVTKKTSTAKKAVTKKTTTAKKTVTKKVAAVPKVVEKTNSQSNSWLPWVLVFMLLGVLFGVFFADFKLGNKFGVNQDMVIVGDQTWMSVPGKPVDILVLNDPNCGQGCDTTAALDALRQNVTPALIVTEISTESDRGQALIKDFDLASIPQYFFAENLATLDAADGTKFVDNLPPGVVELKQNLYHLNKANVGFPTGKYIKTPEFSDLETEPRKGNGPVQVVEFTDYQCPFCKRLHDNNSALIDRLVKEKKITYIVKDFPLNFHPEAVFAHQASNCMLRESGQGAYWDMHDEIFAQSDKWSGNPQAKDFMINLAEGLGTDITACMNDQSVIAEAQSDTQEGSQYGVSGTPALFIGTQFMPGAIGADQFEAAVNAELAN